MPNVPKRIMGQNFLTSVYERIIILCLKIKLKKNVLVPCRENSMNAFVACLFSTIVGSTFTVKHTTKKLYDSD